MANDQRNNYRIFNVTRYDVEALMLAQDLPPSSFLIWSPPLNDDRLTMTVDQFNSITKEHRFYHFAIRKVKNMVSPGYLFSIAQQTIFYSIEKLIESLQDDVKFKLGEPALKFIDDELDFPNINFLQPSMLTSRYTHNTYCSIRPYATSSISSKTTRSREMLLAHFRHELTRQINRGQPQHDENNSSNELRNDIVKFLNEKLHMQLDKDHVLVDMIVNYKNTTEQRKVKHVKYASNVSSIINNDLFERVMGGILQHMRVKFNVEFKKESADLIAQVIQELSTTEHNGVFDDVKNGERPNSSLSNSDSETCYMSIQEARAKMRESDASTSRNVKNEKRVRFEQPTMNAGENSQLSRRLEPIIDHKSSQSELPKQSSANNALREDRPAKYIENLRKFENLSISHQSSSTLKRDVNGSNVFRSTMHERRRPKKDIVAPQDLQPFKNPLSDQLTPSTYDTSTRPNPSSTSNINYTTVVPANSSTQKLHGAIPQQYNATSSKTIDVVTLSNTSANSNVPTSGYNSAGSRDSITTTVDSNKEKPSSPQQIELNDDDPPRNSQIKFKTMLGKGNFAKVYTADIDGEIYAVKVIKCDVFDIREAKNALDIDHQNIVKCYGVDLFPNRPALIKFELMQGGSLLGYLKAAIMPSLSMKSWAAQIANGMRYLEKRGLVHRDLAARNILLDERKEIAKIGDFGLARCVNNDQIYPMNTVKEIPLRWQSLEVFEQMARQENATFTIKNDVWSYGILLHEIYSRGDLPYGMRDNYSIHGLLKNGFRLEKPKEAPNEIYQLMQDCWKLKPEERPTFAQIYYRLS